MKQLYQTPILSDELELKIEDAIQAYMRKSLWKEWGLDKVREQGAAILLHGAPGTGKTITTYYIGKKLHLKVSEVSMADYGSHIPGELARNIRKIFSGELTLAKLEKRQPPIVFLDECDSMLISRKKLGPDMIWMLEPINSLLSEISKYPGLVVLATNLVSVLDEALERRLIAKIRFDRPNKEIRWKIWKAKWPNKFPIQPTGEELEKLSEYDMTGAQIENAFILWAGRCMRAPNQAPRVANLLWFLEGELKNYLQV